MDKRNNNIRYAKKPDRNRQTDRVVRRKLEKINTGSEQNRQENYKSETYSSGNSGKRTFSFSSESVQWTGRLNTKLRKFGNETANLGRRVGRPVANAVDDDTTEGARKVRYYTEDAVGIADMITERAAKKEVFNTYRTFSNQIMAADPKRVGKDFSTSPITRQDYQVFKRLSKGPDYKYDRTAHISPNSNDLLNHKKAENLRNFANFHTVEDHLRAVSMTRSDLFTDSERRMLSQDNRIFQIKNQRDFNNLKALVVKGLNEKGPISSSGITITDWNKTATYQVKAMLMDRNLDTDVKAYLSVLLKMKQTEEKLNKFRVPKGRIQSLFSKISGSQNLMQTDVGQGYLYLQRSLKTGMTTVKVARLAGTTAYDLSKAAGRTAVKATRSLGFEKTANVLDKTGKVLTTPERAVKKVTSIPSRAINKTGEGLRYVSGKAARKVASRMERTTVGRTVKTVNKKVVKPFAKGIDVITKPFRKVTNGFLSFVGKGFSLFRKLVLIGFGAFGIFFIIMLFFLISALNSGTSSSVVTVILDTKEHFQQYQAIYNNLEQQYQGQLDAQIAAGPSTPNTKGEKIPTYGNPDFKTGEDDGSATRNGVTVKYLDKNGNATAASANIEDILSIMAVVMQQSMATDDYHYQAAQELVEAYYKSSHLYMIKESPLYPCEKGCVDISYYCNDPYSGDLQYNILTDIVLKEPDYEEDSDTYGCLKNPVWDCDHSCDAEVCNHDCSNARGGRGCAGYWELYCDGHHTVKGCFGHVDLEMNYIVLSMEDLMDPNFDSVIANIQSSFPSVKGSDGTEYHNYVNDWMLKYPDICEGFLKDNWNEQNIEWAKALRSVDFSVYGITPSFISQSTLTPEEIAQIKENLGDISEVRAGIVATAYEGVGVIPYHWDWRNYDRLHPGLADNRFGTSVPADYKGRNKKGLDCSGFVDWVYLTNGIGSFGTSATGGIWSQCEQISRSQLKPGDLGFKNIPGTSGGVNHVGIFAGLTESGQEIWIHCAGSTGCVKSVGYGGFHHYCRFPALD